MQSTPPWELDRKWRPSSEFLLEAPVLLGISIGAAVRHCPGPRRLLINAAQGTKDHTHDSGVANDGYQPVFVSAKEVPCLGYDSFLKVCKCFGTGRRHVRE